MTRELFHITNSSVIFGCLVCLVYYQPISPSYLVVLSTSKRDEHISAGILKNNVGLLCCSVLLKVVVASDSGKYQQPTVVDTILVILVNTMLPTDYFNSSAVASYTVIRSDHNKSNMCPSQSLVFWIHPYC